MLSDNRRWLAALVLAVCCLIVGLVLNEAVSQDNVTVGRQKDGRVVVPTNQVLAPAGKQVEFAGRPVDLTMIDDGQTLVVKNFKDLTFIDVASGKVKQTLVSPVGFSVVGLLAEKDSIYVTDAKDHLRIAKRGANGTYSWANPMTIPKPKVGGSPNPAGITQAADNMVWVVSTRGNCVHLMDIQDNKVRQTINVGVAPYMVCDARPGVLYVSNWGGDAPKEGDIYAPSSDTDVKVDSRGIASQGTVSVIKDSKVEKSIRVGLHPSSMIANRDGSLLFVANANSDTVSVIRTDTNEVVETILCRPEGRLPFGSGSNALALTNDGTTLYVANGTNNCLAMVQLGTLARGLSAERPEPSRVKGLIPTGWYPGAVRLSADDKKLFVANIKGVGSLSLQKPGDKAPRAEEKGRNSHDHLGSVSIIDVPDDAQLAKYTQIVNENNRLNYSLAGLDKPRADVTERVVPERHGEPSVIKHVIYVIKENRTYDQVFGDMKEGNGDPNLVLYGEEVTPNHHALAREFTLFDNFYCSGVLSADGHQWVNEAYVTDYLEKSFGGFTRSYPYEGGDPLAFASSGFLWDNALDRKRTFRNYGEFVKVIPPKGSTWTDMYNDYKTGAMKIPVEGKVNVEKLRPFTHPTYPGFVLTIPDVYRAKLFIDDLKKYEQEGNFPNLIYLYLPCDHTAGTRPGLPTPRATVADNDLALGQVVEAVSKTKFWKGTCFFVVEDDPQNGFDHVDAHRTVALVISPYTKRHYVDSTCYNQTGMVKTIELVLGLPPMNQLDLSATALRNCFMEKPDLTGYTAKAARIALDEMNPAASKLKGQALHWAKKSMELDLDDADVADEDTFNRILWFAAYGESRPYPEKFAGGKKEER